jgi:hypothetical protein
MSESNKAIKTLSLYQKLYQAPTLLSAITGKNFTHALMKDGLFKLRLAELRKNPKGVKLPDCAFFIAKRTAAKIVEINAQYDSQISELAKNYKLLENMQNMLRNNKILAEQNSSQLDKLDENLNSINQGIIKLYLSWGQRFYEEADRSGVADYRKAVIKPYMSALLLLKSRPTLDFNTQKDIFYRLINEYRPLNNNDMIIKMGVKILKLQPKEGLAYYHIAVAYAAQNDIQQTIDNIELAYKYRDNIFDEAHIKDIIKIRETFQKPSQQESHTTAPS